MNHNMVGCPFKEEVRGHASGSEIPGAPRSKRDSKPDRAGSRNRARAVRAHRARLATEWVTCSKLARCASGSRTSRPCAASTSGRARRAGRSARPERRRQDDDAADAARRGHAGRRHDHDRRAPRSRAAHRGDGAVGFAAGYLPLPDRLKVREALGVFAGWYGVRDHRAAVDEALERFEIAHLADRMCTELSSGQRTLVGIVKATLHDPELLVLDEPTASLDPDIALKVRKGLLDVLRDERGGAARHEPRHARGGDAHRAGDLPRPRRGRRQRHAGRDRRPVRPRRPRARVPRPRREHGRDGR